jgi:hypothetical protein
MAMAEYVTKVHAICMQCGDLATFSHRMTASQELVVLGETDSYQPLVPHLFHGPTHRGGEHRPPMNPHGHRLSAIARALGTTVHGDGFDPLIEHLVIDSRKPLPEHGALFIALPGDRHDGHHYLPALVERGLQCAVVDRPAPGVPLTLHVTDTRDALQRIAAWHRAQHQLPVVGITGSNGKTVVKEWLFQLLRDEEHIVRSPGSWNSQVGVPLSVWELRPEHTLALFEAGISKPGEMALLRPIIHPTIGLFTTLGPAHGEHFSSPLHKAREKLALFHDVEVLVYCADHAVVQEAIHLEQLDQRVQLRGWSREQSAWLHVLREEPVAHGHPHHGPARRCACGILHPLHGPGGGGERPALRHPPAPPGPQSCLAGRTYAAADTSGHAPAGGGGHPRHHAHQRRL